MSKLHQTGSNAGIARRVSTTALCAALLATNTAAQAATDDLVLIRGFTVAEESLLGVFPSTNQVWSFGPDEAQELRERACEFKKTRFDMEYREKLHQMDQEAGVSFSYLEAKASGDSDEFYRESYRKMGENRKILNASDWAKSSREKMKQCGPEDPIQSFNIIYASCAMYMEQKEQEMLITLPPSTNGAVMQLRAPGEDPMAINLNQTFDRFGDFATIDHVSVTPRKATHYSNSTGNHLGLATREYMLKLEGASFIGSKFSSGGTAYVAADAPGLDVVRAFHRNFSNEVRSPGLAGAFLNGLVDQMARVTKHGLPMYQDLTVSSVTGTGTSVGIVGREVQVVTGILTVPRDVAPPALANFCDSSIIGKGEKTQDLGEMMGVSGSAASAANGKAQSEMQRAMEQAAEAMEGLDPATRAIMEKMGIKIPGMGSGN